MNELIHKWFPGKPEISLAARLEEFYRNREDYHEMTASSDKLKDPQVGLLDCLVKKGGKYLEAGCGSGMVSRHVARIADVTGIDASDIAIAKAKKSSAGNTKCRFIQASVYSVPLPDNCMDGVFSLEVLEHLMDPMAAFREMARVVSPGGFILISAPNRFSADYHLNKKLPARGADMIMALSRFILDNIRRKPFVLFEPDLEGAVFADCDAVSTVIPRFFCRQAASMGTETVFWDSAYMCANGKESRTDLKYQRIMSKGFMKHYGDHFLFLFRKQS